MRAVPTGFDHHKTPQESQALRDFEPRHPVNELMPELDAARYQLGTLGGGNHFIELQADPEGRLCVMIHSGSRNLGYKIASHFDKLAIALNTRWYSAVPVELVREWLLARNIPSARHLTATTAAELEAWIQSQNSDLWDEDETFGDTTDLPF